MSETPPFPIDAIRARFPALAVCDPGGQRVYFDAPGGTHAVRRMSFSESLYGMKMNSCILKMAWATSFQTP